MTPVNGISWNKVMTLSASFGIPLLSIGYWFVVQGTHLVDKVDLISIKQIQTDAHIDIISMKLDRLSNRVDTIASKQNKFGLYTQNILTEDEYLRR